MQREKKILHSHPRVQEDEHARKIVCDGWAARRLHLR